MPFTDDGVRSLTDAHRFEMCVDAISDYAIYMLDPEGLVMTWNTGATKIKQYTATEIIGQHFSRFFTNEDRADQVPEMIIEKARTFGRYEGENLHVRKDGGCFWCNTILHSIADEDGKLVGFATIQRDVTQRRETEERLRQSERCFRMLVEGAVDYAICLLDPSGIVVNWNSGAERLKGYTATEIVGQHFSRFYTREERAAGVPVRVLDTAARDGRYEAEGWRVRKDGSRFWALVVIDAIRNESGDLEGFAKVTRDITERRSAQDALRESERQFRLLVSGATDYALCMLDPNGIVASWNAGAERIKGYTADEIVGQHFSRFYPERDRAAGMPARALVAAAQEGRYEAEGWRIRKDGSMFWAHVIIDPIHDECKNLVGFAKITRDVTERREAHAALQKAQEQRAHLQKMDALGQLTGGVAHDFNNLLMVMGGQAQLLKKRFADNPSIRRAAEAIDEAAARGEALTRQLLTFSRRQAINPSIFGVVERVEKFREMMASSLGATVKLAAVLEPQIWPVKADPSEFELALVNLTLNARDAMPAGGVITLTAENTTLTGEETTARVAGDFVAFRIADNGTGIAPDLLQRVFDPFFTTKPPEKGNGLGLSQVYGFAHQSGGTVAIESELGKGTIVTLYVPRGSETIYEADALSEVQPAASGAVLLVDDNPEVADISGSMLKELGYRVKIVSDAAAALEALKGETFDLVVSDIIMAGEMDGLALAQVIRARQSNLPVLLVTGYSDLVRQASVDFPVLNKPLKLSEMSRVAARMIAESKQPAGTNIVRLRDARQNGINR